MKARPKLGDRVEFKFARSTRKGKVIGVAVSGVHFLVEMDLPRSRYKWRADGTKWVSTDHHRRVPLHQITRILSEPSTAPSGM